VAFVVDYRANGGRPLNNYGASVYSCMKGGSIGATAKARRNLKEAGVTFEGGRGFVFGGDRPPLTELDDREDYREDRFHHHRRANERPTDGNLHRARWAHQHYICQKGDRRGARNGTTSATRGFYALGHPSSVPERKPARASANNRMDWQEFRCPDRTRGNCAGHDGPGQQAPQRMMPAHDAQTSSLHSPRALRMTQEEFAEAYASQSAR